jgi:hypothetical protein
MSAELDTRQVEQILARLAEGSLEMEGLVPWGSNYTFLVRVNHALGELEAIYKPSKGERPLWDFARGTLCLRERAAFLVSEALGWRIVPPTVLREGPHGRGSVQQYVDHDPEQHYLTLKGRFAGQARRVAVFDLLVNNADRKSGHVIVAPGGRLWAIDHGVTFHAEPKLRSVIWDFAGEPIPDDIRESLVAFHAWLCYGKDQAYLELGQLLAKQELQALRERLDGLIAEPVFPRPGSGRHYPWPLI